MIHFKVWRFLVVYVLNPTLLVPVAAYLWSRYRGTYAKPIGLPGAVPREFLEASFGVLGTGLAFAGIPNVGLLHLTRPLTFVATLLVVLQIPAMSRLRRNWYLVAMGLGLLAAAMGYALDTPAYRNSVFTTVQSLIYLIVSSIELRWILMIEDDVPVAARPEFWFFSALLVFASGSLLFNATSNYFLRTLTHDLLPIPWVAVNVVYVMYYFLMAKVFLCPKPTSS
ncbi:hypothetical protein [Geothrix sp. PMB-07]|uniref:hypothetical protein n=1 Tax=Geothrix sp. PMB-07 TaxID=3068640 RepID=UPI0027422ACB|nr:hypothetical protein [Geothrix sp. PMB-07]WLT33119.1 hypothetical protein Q9293_07260 [Geothrix sp. PMB-07]